MDDFGFGVPPILFVATMRVTMPATTTSVTQPAIVIDESEKNHSHPFTNQNAATLRSPRVVPSGRLQRLRVRRLRSRQWLRWARSLRRRPSSG